MQIIKLNATDSTNTYLKDLLAETHLADYSVVIAKNQTQGKGQRGEKWLSEKGKNLTVSILKLKPKVALERQFLLNTIVSLSLIKTLEGYNVPNLAVKWPNDILSGHHKIAGILIENIIKSQHIESSVIGVGLNVNQKSFNGLPKVTSLKTILGRSLNLEELLSNLLQNIKYYFTAFENSGEELLNSKYETYLFRKDKPSTFQLPDHSLFTGIIRGVTASGKLQLQTEDALKTYGLKELSLLY